MMWFGVGPWCHACSWWPRKERPVGAACIWCRELIGPTDSGVLMPVTPLTGAPEIGAEHAECFLRTVFGTVAHQKRLCSCYGGAEEDGEPHVTRREEARRAVRYAYARTDIH